MAFFFTMRAIAYIDGFNLFYGALKKSPYKWLNLEALIKNISPEYYDIICIKYFTARISPLSKDWESPSRQAIYLRALKTRKNIQIYEGHFLAHVVHMPLITEGNFKKNFRQYKMKTVPVLKREEKGSDVNLACHLLMDAVEDQYDCAIIVSNDSDLFTPMEMVKEKYNKKLRLISPHKRKSAKLCQIADYITGIKKTDLKNNQFPEILRDDRGEFQKPSSW